MYDLWIIRSLWIGGHSYLSIVDARVVPAETLDGLRPIMDDARDDRYVVDCIATPCRLATLPTATRRHIPEHLIGLVDASSAYSEASSRWFSESLTRQLARMYESGHLQETV
jgi:hypothetical protein